MSQDLQCFNLLDNPVLSSKGCIGFHDLAVKTPRSNSAPIHFSKCVIYNDTDRTWTVRTMCFKKYLKLPFIYS